MESNSLNLGLFSIPAKDCNNRICVGIVENNNNDNMYCSLGFEEVQADKLDDYIKQHSDYIEETANMVIEFKNTDNVEIVTNSLEGELIVVLSDVANYSKKDFSVVLDSVYKIYKHSNFNVDSVRVFKSYVKELIKDKKPLLLSMFGDCHSDSTYVYADYDVEFTKLTVKNQVYFRMFNVFFDSNYRLVKDKVLNSKLESKINLTKF